MSDMSKHATKRSSAAPAAWLVLGTMGLASVVFQIDHALGGGLPRWLIAGVVGFAPVAVSLGVAHMIALHRGGTLVRVAAILVMACGMTLSMGAIAWVVGPYYHSWLRWLFGLLLDGAALFAAWVLLGDHARRAAEADAVEAAQAAARTAAVTASEAAGKAAALEAELVGARAELEAEQLRSSALNTKLASGRTRARRSAPNKRARSPLNQNVPDDVDTQAEALRILTDEPAISGGELGRRLGKSESYGCRLRNKLAASVADPEAG